MNVFEDLLVDLKEQNLLEDTVLEERPYGAGFVQEHDNTYVPNRSVPTSRTPDPEAEASKSGAIVEPNGASPAVSSEGISPAAGNEFFKKRAISEVSSFQMVERVLTGA